MPEKITACRLYPNGEKSPPVPAEILRRAGDLVLLAVPVGTMERYAWCTMPENGSPATITGQLHAHPHIAPDDYALMCA